MLVDGERMSGSLFDFGLYFFHCARPQLDRGSGPYFYLPKMESHLEARLWNDVFVHAQDALGIPQGTHPRHRADRDLPGRVRDGGDPLRAARPLRRPQRRPLGLHVQRHQEASAPAASDFLLPDRNSVTMTVPFMRAYTELLVRTCHKRGAHAIGGMAAFIPSKDEQTNERAFAKVRDDKTREAGDGFDGSWVAHPGMVAACTEVFDAVLGDAPEPASTSRATTCEVERRAAARRGIDAGRGHRGGPAQQRQRRPAVPRVLAAGHRRGRHQQPDGGRRHRRDLPLAGVAVAAQLDPARRRPDGHPRTWWSG